MWKKEAFAPTSISTSALPERHGCEFVVEETFPWRLRELSKSRNKLVDTKPSSAFSPKFTSGMRWILAVSVAPGSALNVTSVIEGIQVSWMNT